MKSLIINNEDLHLKLKILAATSKKSMIDLLEEAIKDLLEKYNNEHTREN